MYVYVYGSIIANIKCIMSYMYILTKASLYHLYHAIFKSLWLEILYNVV